MREADSLPEHPLVTEEDSVRTTHDPGWRAGRGEVYRRQRSEVAHRRRLRRHASLAGAATTYFQLLMHFWATHAEAERYARSRPYFHDLVVERMLATLGIRGRVALALDIGSGSGQSATALAALADDVVAMDPSRPMLLSATDLNPQRIQAVGESLPIVDSCCDLMTVALSFHWLDRDRFLTEASRVLRTSGRLVIYNDFFLGRMRENPSFQTWHNGQYLKRYPVPARHDQPLTDADASRCGLGIIERQTYAHEVTFDVEELSSYLATQTNIIAAVQSGAVRAHDVRRWLIHSVADLFPRPKCCFAFGGIVWYLRPL